MSDREPPDHDWRVRFTETFARPVSAVQERIWRQVFGAEYPEGLDIYSFVTVSELARISVEVDVGAGDVLLDMACGRGGPGIWVAAHTGARLIGVDIAETAVAAARARAAQAGLSDSAFQVGTFDDSGLADAGADAAMSIDALLFAPDKAAALAELARVLRPGGRLVVTTWDYHSQPRGRPPQVADHRPLLTDAGFETLAYDETDRWRETLSEIDRLLMANADELAEEEGADPDEVCRDLAEMGATISCMIRRVLFVAVRR
jgi:cyclopropane fatty-acyl-phospholipid synthase-like methyltransferase